MCAVAGIQHTCISAASQRTREICGRAMDLPRSLVYATRTLNSTTKGFVKYVRCMLKAWAQRRLELSSASQHLQLLECASGNSGGTSHECRLEQSRLVHGHRSGEVNWPLSGTIDDMTEPTRALYKHFCSHGSASYTFGAAQENHKLTAKRVDALCEDVGHQSRQFKQILAQVDQVVAAAIAWADASNAVQNANKDRKGSFRTMSDALELRDAAEVALHAAVEALRAPVKHDAGAGHG